VKVQCGFRLEDELIEKVDDLAAGENRDRTNMVETLLYEAVRARDPKWKPSPKKPKK
jgi:predicted transcriptional regulator